MNINILSRYNIGTTITIVVTSYEANEVSYKKVGKQEKRRNK